MARIKDTNKFNETRDRLVSIGIEMIRSESFTAVSVGDLIARSGIPKGSFYHYFENKEAYGIAVARSYSQMQIKAARQIFDDPGLDAKTRVREFFRKALDDYKARDFKQGCLMANLSTELADENEVFRLELKENWKDLSEPLAMALRKTGTAWIGQDHLSAAEAADWLLNAWTGALARMKAEASGAPLRLFEKAIFKD